MLPSFFGGGALNFAAGFDVGQLSFEDSNVPGFFFVCNINYLCQRSEPRSHFKSRLSLIVRVNVVLNRAVVVDSD